MDFDFERLRAIGFGLVVLYVACRLFRRQKAFEAASTLTTGIVTDILTMERSEHNGRYGTRKTTYYAPVVEFRTAKGALMTHTSRRYIAPNRYAIGMELEIRYNPDRPLEAQVKDGFLNWFWPAAIALAGVFICIVGAVGTIQPG